MSRRQAGFTLTELMVVVTIIGVLVTMAIVYMRPRVRPIDVATRVGDLVHEANRRAVALGPVRADVVVALGSKARTQILATKSGTVVTFTLYRLQEATPAINSTWLPIPEHTYAVDANVTAVKWAFGVGDRTMSGLLTTWNTFLVQCKPDGICDAATIFFESSIPGPSALDCQTTTSPVYELCGKLSIMPLGGAITTRPDWL